MRKLIVTEFYSLDGLMSDSEDKMDWVTTTFSQDMGKYVGDVYANADTLFLGEVTYQIMATYWPTADTNPEVFQGDAESAQTMNSIRKVVFSNNLKDLAWSYTALKTEIVPEEIKKMKQELGKNMLVAGSASIVQQLTQSMY
jgi:dihydrofolate reductase